MTGDAQLLTEALDHLEAGGLRLGEGWEKAHDICQSREGVAEFDWIHALCHRIEGDDWNADYWYRRAGRTRGQGTVAEECAGIRAELLGRAPD